MKSRPPVPLPIDHAVRADLGLEADLFDERGALKADDLEVVRRVANRLGQVGEEGGAGRLAVLVLVQETLKRLVEEYRRQLRPDALSRALEWLDERFGASDVRRVLSEYASRYRSDAVPGSEPELLEELVLLWLANVNPAFAPYRRLVSDESLEAATGYRRLVESLEEFFAGLDPGRSFLGGLRRTLVEAGPSPAVQLERLRAAGALAPPPLEPQARRRLDLLREEERPPFVPPDPGAPPAGPAPESIAPSFESEVEEELEAYTADRSWMASTVLVAKHTLVWLDQLEQSTGRPVRTLDAIPDRALAELAGWGINALWLVGLWERSPASAVIARRAGHPTSVGSAYSIRAYRVAAELGGEAALERLSERAGRHGIRLACDMVPNHYGIDSEWVIDHPERFLALDESPFPGYRFTGSDLSPDPSVGIYLEDGYEDRSDAAVVFKRVHQATGLARYVYHGNDGTGLPWNDTAQLDYLSTAVREAVIEEILGVARAFPIVRFDAAMTLARRHVRRLWHPQPGEGGAIPSRVGRGVEAEVFERLMPREFWREVVDRVQAEAPDTMLLAEAFWLLEGYFVRTLGFHRVYNSAFMNMLRDGAPRELTRMIGNVLAFDPDILARHVNFLTNPDERPTAATFGKGERYLAAATLLVTLPGTPMFGHGQIEGLLEQYGMEYGRAAYDESGDRAFVRRHETRIVPLLRHRTAFAGSTRFQLLEVEDREGGPLESVVAFVNGDGSGAALVVVNFSDRPVGGWIRRTVPRRNKERGEWEVRELVDLLGPGSDGAEGRDAITGEQVTLGELARGLEIELEPWAARVLVELSDAAVTGRQEPLRAGRPAPPPRVGFEIPTVAAGPAPGMLGEPLGVARDPGWSGGPEAAALLARLDPGRWQRRVAAPSFVGRLTEDRWERAIGDPEWVGALRAAARSRREPSRAGPGRPRVLVVGPDLVLGPGVELARGGRGLDPVDLLEAGHGLGLSMLGVGLAYRALDRRAGRLFDPLGLGAQPVADSAGRELRVPVALEAGDVMLRVWLLTLGSARVLLLDPDLTENEAEARWIAASPWAGGRIGELLAVGTAAVLETLGLEVDLEVGLPVPSGTGRSLGGPVVHLPSWLAPGFGSPEEPADPPTVARVKRRERADLVGELAFRAREQLAASGRTPAGLGPLDPADPSAPLVVCELREGEAADPELLQSARDGGGVVVALAADRWGPPRIEMSGGAVRVEGLDLSLARQLVRGADLWRGEGEETSSLEARALVNGAAAVRTVLELRDRVALTEDERAALGADSIVASGRRFGAAAWLEALAAGPGEGPPRSKRSAPAPPG